jgi:hypothetical protein
MASLLDIAPIKRKVPVMGQELEVGGLSALGIAHLLQRIPEVRKMLSGMDFEFTMERLVEAVPEAAGVIIASACGYEGNDEAEAAANRIPLGEQVEILETVLDLTIPGGLAPFVKKLRSLMAVVSSNDASGAGTKAPGGKSPSK